MNSNLYIETNKLEKRSRYIFHELEKKKDKKWCKKINDTILIHLDKLKKLWKKFERITSEMWYKKWEEIYEQSIAEINKWHKILDSFEIKEKSTLLKIKHKENEELYKCYQKMIKKIEKVEYYIEAHLQANRRKFSTTQKEFKDSLFNVSDLCRFAIFLLEKKWFTKDSEEIKNINTTIEKCNKFIDKYKSFFKWDWRFLETKNKEWEVLIQQLNQMVDLAEDPVAEYYEEFDETSEFLNDNLIEI